MYFFLRVMLNEEQKTLDPKLNILESCKHHIHFKVRLLQSISNFYKQRI
jgi:hypothetical protein